MFWVKKLLGRLWLQWYVSDIVWCMFNELTYSRNDPSGPMQWHGQPHGDSCPRVALWSQYNILIYFLSTSTPTASAENLAHLLSWRYESSCYRGWSCNLVAPLGLLLNFSKTTQWVREFSDILWEMIKLQKEKFQFINNDQPDGVCKFYTLNVRRRVILRKYLCSKRPSPSRWRHSGSIWGFLNSLASLGCMDSNWKADIFRHECRSW